MQVLLHAIDPNQIDPNIVDQNWFKKHQSTFGNANYLMKYGFIITRVYSVQMELHDSRQSMMQTQIQLLRICLIYWKQI